MLKSLTDLILKIKMKPRFLYLIHLGLSKSFSVHVYLVIVQNGTQSSKQSKGIL